MNNTKGNKIHVIFQKNERIEGYVNIWNGINGIIDKIGNILMVIIANERKGPTTKQ